MPNKKKVVIAFASIVVIVLALSFLINQQPRLIGFSVFSGGCAESISEEGYWELSSPLSSCTNTTGLTLTASNIVLDCKNNPITLDTTANITEDTTGILISSNLTNITIQNCNLSDFDNAILTGDELEISIINTTAEANDFCVIGSWTDDGGNGGCLDIVGPIITVTNQTTYDNSSFSYQTTATDVSGISTYTINQSGNGTFAIDAEGIITNITTLIIENHTLTLIVTDLKNQSSSVEFTIEILNGTTTFIEEVIDTPPEEDEEETTTPASTSEKKTTPVASNKVIDCKWECTDWGECTDDGFRRKTCKRLVDDCNSPVPPTKESCTVEDITTDETIEETNPVEETPTIEEETEVSSSFLTGAVVSLKSIGSKIKDSSSTQKIIGTFLLIAVIGIIAFFIMRKHLKNVTTKPGQTRAKPSFLSDKLNKKTKKEEDGDDLIKDLFKKN